MSEVFLALYGVNHSERLSKTIAEKPYRISGAVVAIEGKEVQAASIYANIRTAYMGVLKNLRDNDFVGKEEGVIDDFTLVGFPIMIPNLGALETVDVVIGIREGMLITELFFQYKGSTAMLYTTEVHTSNTIGLQLPSQYNRPAAPQAPQPING